MTRCLFGALRAKTVIVVTQERRILRRANIVYLLADGEIVAKGQFKDLLKVEQLQPFFNIAK